MTGDNAARNGHRQASDGVLLHDLTTEERYDVWSGHHGGCADAGAGGMSISSGSSASACGGVPSSSTSDSSAMAHTGEPSAISGSICFANKSPVACSSLALLINGFVEFVVAVGAQSVTVVCAQFLKLRKTAKPEACKHDVLCGEMKWPSWRPTCPRWRGCWPCPRESSTLVLPCSGTRRRPEWPRF